MADYLDNISTVPHMAASQLVFAMGEEWCVDLARIITANLAVEKNNRTQFKRGNVVMDIESGDKRVMIRDIDLATAEYEFVCEEPHQDGDCRCYQ